jgi:prophage DNA circulation protein
MSVFEKMYPGSFRGVPFLVESESREGGKKVAIHEFVNSDNRFTEELGKLPGIFTLEVVVHGDDAIQRRINLERVLQISGIGDLVHPVYGNIKVKSTTFNVNSNQRNIGQFRFSITFNSSKANVTVAPETETKSSVSNAAEDAREALNDALESNYANPEIPDTLESSGNKLDDIYEDVFSSVSGGVNLVQDKVSTFTRTVSEGRSKVFSIVQQGFIVKDSVKDLYDSALDVVNTPEDLLESWKRLVDFGFLDIQGLTDTVFRRNKENNKSSLNEHTRINALINTFEATAYTDFETETELDAAQKVLDDNYELLINGFDTGSDDVESLAENPEVRKTMAELRTRTRKVLNDKDQNTWRVVDIEPGISSMALTSYRYYESLDNVDILRRLNTSVNAANFDTSIQAVSR